MSVMKNVWIHYPRLELFSSIRSQNSRSSAWSKHCSNQATSRSWADFYRTLYQATAIHELSTWQDLVERDDFCKCIKLASRELNVKEYNLHTNIAISLFHCRAANISILQLGRFSSPIRKIFKITYNFMDKNFKNHEGCQICVSRLSPLPQKKSGAFCRSGSVGSSATVAPKWNFSWTVNLGEWKSMITFSAVQEDSGNSGKKCQERSIHTDCADRLSISFTYNLFYIPWLAI